MNKERKIEILKEYEKEGHLRYVQEYKDWVNNNIIFNATEEIEYIIKKSWEDTEAPFSYYDINPYYKPEEIMQAILRDYDLKNKDDVIKVCEPLGLDGEEVFKSGDAESIIMEDLEEYGKQDYYCVIEELELDLPKATDVLEWWAITEHIKYWLEQEGEITMFNYWGRRASGQELYLDRVLQKAYINMLKNKL